MLKINSLNKLNLKLKKKNIPFLYILTNTFTFTKQIFMLKNPEKKMMKLIFLKKKHNCLLIVAAKKTNLH